MTVAVRILDALTGKTERVFRASNDEISGTLCIPNTNILVTASDYGTVRFWDLKQSKEIGRLKNLGVQGPFAVNFQRWLTVKHWHSSLQDRVDQAVQAEQSCARHRRPQGQTH